MHCDSVPDMLILITLFELASVMLWTAFLSQKSARLGAVCRTAVILILLLSSGILGAQLSSICSTGHYLDALTFSNLKSWRDAGWRIVLSSAAITVSCMLLTLTAALLPLQKFCRHHGRTILICCLVCLAACCADQKGAFRNFNHAYRSYLKQKAFRTDPEIRKIQQQIYGQNETFGNAAQAESVPDLRGKNIVVIFAEGFSAEWIDLFNRYSGLTPNIDSFLGESLYFDGYFNHTAATFRGLRGQLTSSYQTEGGYYRTNDGLGQISGEKLRKKLAGNLVSVPQILEKNGFHTYFLSAHERKEQLNLMLETLEFGRVFGADDFYEGAQRLTDRQLFSVLKELVSGGRLRQPYFLGLYNIGTHLGQNSPDEKYGSGKNTLLNTIRNFDDAFGRFWSSVRDRKDLAVILTADHAAYPSDLYNLTFGTQRSYFADRIPFAVWTGGTGHRVIDAGGRNSLDFAPTLLQMMGIKNAFNYFLGCSLFSKECRWRFQYITNIDDSFWETPSLRRLSSRNEDDREIMRKIRDFYHLSENVE